MSESTKERMAVIAAELIKRFEAAGFNPTEYKYDYGQGEFSVNRKAIVIDEKTTSYGFRHVGNGKLFVKFSGADYHMKLFHERQGQIDYDKVISAFIDEQVLIRQRENEQAKETEQRGRIKAFIADNQISKRIGVNSSEYNVSIKCVDEQELYKLMLVLNEALKSE